MTRPTDLYFDASDPPGADAVKVTWLGTAGFAIAHGDHVLLLDPYLTRASLARCVFAPLRPDAALAQRLVPRADAIVLSHTHFDHALDAPTMRVVGINRIRAATGVAGSRPGRGGTRSRARSDICSLCQFAR